MSDSEKGSSNEQEQAAPSNETDPYAGRVVHHYRYGVWDMYEELNPDAGKLNLRATVRQRAKELSDSAPYLLRAVKDVLAIPGCKRLVALYGVSKFASAFMPALSVWLQGKMLSTMDAAVKSGSLDLRRIISICAGRVACTIAQILLNALRDRAQSTLDERVRRRFLLYAFIACARVDLPTSERTEVRRDLNVTGDGYQGAPVWNALKSLADVLGVGVQVSAQAWALWDALRGQPSGRLMAVFTLLSETIPWLSLYGVFDTSRAWAMTTKDKDYVKMIGWRKVVREPEHRKELVAGNLANFAISEYKGSMERLGDNGRHWASVGESGDLINNKWGAAKQVFSHIPQFIYSIRAGKNPARWAEALASMHLMQSTASSFAMSVVSVVQTSRNMEYQLMSIRQIYEIGSIENAVQDGTVAFPADPGEVASGISLEFRNVSFKYPGSKTHALKNISFTLRPGQLCVIVGSNGAGKSTILKLIVRLYDPDEGTIFFGGHDIRTLKLNDIRQAVSVLFQDYTHFPLSIRDNIALGDPLGAGDDDHVRLAARLGGAEAFIEKLDGGFDTLLDRNDIEVVSGPSEGSKTALGAVFDATAVRAAAGIKASTSSTKPLSGGQMQRLAVARSFMRSIVREDAQVGLLLFDEPSASLDPVAEHDLFDRLRELRGNKTMVFSSHRFGKLTRHADLILYMDDSGIIESGTHEELLGRKEEYARLWEIQAQAFVS